MRSKIPQLTDAVQSPLTRFALIAFVLLMLLCAVIAARAQTPSQTQPQPQTQSQPQSYQWTQADQDQYDRDRDRDRNRDWQRDRQDRAVELERRLTIMEKDTAFLRAKMEWVEKMIWGTIIGIMGLSGQIIITDFIKRRTAQKRLKKEIEDFEKTEG